MKFVIQRVLNGSVKVNEKIVGEIGPGLVVLIGFTHTDKRENLKFAANKLLSMRLWDDEKGTRWKECVKDRKYGLLIVSQFTLYSFLKGNKPDYHKAMDPKNAIILYDEFLKILRQIYDPAKIQSGMFGEMMHVSLTNDGPVTINWEYPELPDKDAISENDKENDLKLKVKNSNNKNNNKNNDEKIQNVEKNVDNNFKKNSKNGVIEVEKDLNKLNFIDEEKLAESGVDNLKFTNDEDNPNLIKLPCNKK